MNISSLHTSTPESEFDLWYSDTHYGTGEIEIESDVDETVEDSYRDYEVDEI
jgi:hypothetical protein